MDEEVWIMGCDCCQSERSIEAGQKSERKKGKKKHIRRHSPNGHRFRVTHGMEKQGWIGEVVVVVVVVAVVGAARNPTPRERLEISFPPRG